MSLYGNETSDVVKNLNNYFLRNIKDTNADIRFANLVLKYGKSQLGFRFIKKNQIYSDLFIFVRRILKIRLSK